MGHGATTTTQWVGPVLSAAAPVYGPAGKPWFTAAVTGSAMRTAMHRNGIRRPPEAPT